MTVAPRRAHGPPAGTGILRREPEDFVVVERLGFELDGAGEHLWLRIRKRNANTHWIAGRLAKLANVRNVDVGYSGLKDRRAVTEQWFSVRTPQDSLPVDLPEVQILESTRHGKKLKRGVHCANEFSIRVTDLSGDEESLAQRLETLKTSGVPNYFGSQRFGRDDANVKRACAWFDGGRSPRRNDRSLALSAARSYLFNAFLSRRVQQGSWDRVIAGDIVQLDGRGSWFALEHPDSETVERVMRGELHPTAALWGLGSPETCLEAQQYETPAGTLEQTLARGIETRGVKAARRSTRLPVRDLEWCLDGNVLTMRFRLTRGAFATSVIRELMEPTRID